MYEGRSHYEVLGLKVKPNATLIEIKDAYRKTCHEHYCALYKDLRLLTSALVKFNSAFLDLSNMEKRKQYDYYERQRSQIVRDHGIKDDDEYLSLYIDDYDEYKQREFVSWLEGFSDAIRQTIKSHPVLSQDRDLYDKIEEYYCLILEQEKGKVKGSSRK